VITFLLISSVDITMMIESIAVVVAIRCGCCAIVILKLAQQDCRNCVTQVGNETLIAYLH